MYSGHTGCQNTRRILPSNRRLCQKTSQGTITKTEEKTRIQAVCQLYRITEKQLIAKGKKRKPSEARSVIAWIVRESENLTLEVWGERCGRDGVTLSNAIRILPERVKTDKDLVNRMKEIEEKLSISFGSDSPQPLRVP